LQVEEESEERSMKHKQFEEWLQLSLYHELSEQERVFLDDHLTSCKQCQSNLGELKKLHGTLAHRQSVAAQESLLQDARRNLRLRIHAGAAQKSLWMKAKEALDGVLAPPLQVALGGVALLAIGILVGYIAFKSPTEKYLALKQTAAMSSAIEAGESQITNIRFLDRDAQTGNVEFTFETITPVHIRGNVNEEHVQKVLARALVSDQNAGTRLRAVNMIGTQTGQRQDHVPGFDAEVKSALVTALLHDRNLGVRKEALSVLRNYLPDPVIVRAFLQVLASEKNTGLKIAAINSLDLSQYENQPVNREILEMFKQKAQSDDNNYIRIKAKAALQEVQQ
jgi:anti-sigma factor RsiW